MCLHWYISIITKSTTHNKSSSNHGVLRLFVNAANKDVAVGRFTVPSVVCECNQENSPKEKFVLLEPPFCIVIRTTWCESTCWFPWYFFPYYGSQSILKLFCYPFYSSSAKTLTWPSPSPSISYSSWDHSLDLNLSFALHLKCSLLYSYLFLHGWLWVLLTCRDRLAWYESTWQQ